MALNGHSTPAYTQCPHRQAGNCIHPVQKFHTSILIVNEPDLVTMKTMKLYNVLVNQTTETEHGQAAQPGQELKSSNHS